MSIGKEFREFALRGNVMDMAVGIIIGGAFGKIVSSLVTDIMMPPLGRVLGNVNFGDLYFSLDPKKTEGINSLAKAKETGAAVIAYGQFINVIIDFTIVAFCVFLMVKAINTLRARHAPPAAAPTTTECPYCLSVIPLNAKRCAHCTSDLSAAR